jgi:transcriptional regulator of acetoin/glycerol metabolism
MVHAFDQSHASRDDVSRRTFLDRAWQSFVGRGLEVDGVADAIVRSWRRARDTFAIDPGQRRCPKTLTRSELASRRDSDETYGIALPLLEEFGTQLGAGRHVLTFFDADGYMLSIGGDPRTADSVAEINFSPGANWSEESAGTNGPGTALAERRPIEVFASEHFVEAWQAWTCSAAPILAPGTGDLVGLVDITGHWNAHDLQALVTARAIARAVEDRLRSVQIVREQVVQYAFRTAAGSGDGLFAVDGRGRVLAANDAARRRLGFEAHEVPQQIRESLAALLRLGAKAPDGELVVEWPGGSGKVNLTASPVHYERHAVGAVVRVLGPGGAPRRAAPRPTATSRYEFDQILGASVAIADAIALARSAARNDLPVVLFGESGTGKELFAQSIHSASARGGGPFIAVNCGCIPSALLEAELFGYEAGTFTGGKREGSTGKFEEASGGTLFLDEVSELSPQAQTALLRVLQEREIVRLGGSTPRRVDIRIVAASNKDLDAEIAAGRFRSDLFFRLNVLAISVPPLRERRADVAPLALGFLRDAEDEVGRRGLSLTPDALGALEMYSWPGNVRQLRNVILRVAANAPGSVICAADLPKELAVRADALGAALAPPEAPAQQRAAVGPLPQARFLDRESIVRALEAMAWNVTHTAQALEISRMTLYRWMQKFSIVR